MRWDHLRHDGSADSPEGPDEGPSGPSALPLFERDTVTTRTFDTPEFRGMTFHEVNARSVLTRVPGGPGMPRGWHLNPYRGCSHACVYCFARKSHEYLDLDAGLDFDRQIVVKVNAPAVVRRELAGRARPGDHVAMGTNVDCYQRAEGRYRLMPGILAALRDYRVSFSILTKGSLILRDLELLREAAERATVETAVSVGFTDSGLWRSLEPGTPSPRARLEVCASLTGAGLPCAVLMSPIVPYLSDSPAQLRATVKAVAESGAVSIAPEVMYLRPGSREWFMGWLAEHHPGLVGRYRRLYGEGVYAPRWYQNKVLGRVRELAREYGVGPPRTFHTGRPPQWEETGRSPDDPEDSGPTQLTLM
ncbi:Rv2578c family radical SAM protein [Streptomyces sp. NBC_01012]|uniref:Rv2578c family radical SAM protein n=1 Tax=Streptomyces sp. NBC_01012 TaxID=2903717 RepID=UPI00386B83F1|nr:Rv2578c family radical SAM protein [Streptomyces sp. NBC_01012]